MRQRDIWTGYSYRVRDYEEMLSDQRLKHNPDGTIFYPRGHRPFSPDMVHLCGKTFTAAGFNRYDGYIEIWNRDFRDDHGKWYRIEAWMVEDTDKPYRGKTYDKLGFEELAMEEITDEDRERLFSDLIGYQPEGEYCG